MNILSFKPSNSDFINKLLIFKMFSWSCLRNTRLRQQTPSIQPTPWLCIVLSYVCLYLPRHPPYSRIWQSSSRNYFQHNKLRCFIWLRFEPITFLSNTGLSFLYKCIEHLERYIYYINQQRKLTSIITFKFLLFLKAKNFYKKGPYVHQDML